MHDTAREVESPLLAAAQCLDRNIGFLIQPDGAEGGVDPLSLLISAQPVGGGPEADVRARGEVFVECEFLWDDTEVLACISDRLSHQLNRAFGGP